MIRDRISNKFLFILDRITVHASLQAEYYNPGIRNTLNAYVSLDYLILIRYDLFDFNAGTLRECRVHALDQFHLRTFVNYHIRRSTMLDPIQCLATLEFNFFSHKLVRGIKGTGIGRELLSYDLCHPRLIWFPKRSIKVLKPHLSVDRVALIRLLHLYSI